MVYRPILIVEDDKANQLALAVLLQRLGYEYAIVESGREAIEAFAKGNYALILMDIRMPEITGIDAALAIRSLEKSLRRGRIPIIAITASDQRGNCMEAGMDDYLRKPYTFEELAAITARWLFRRGAA
jgi:CheY-like chemotaxis protein